MSNRVTGFSYPFSSLISHSNYSVVGLCHMSTFNSFSISWILALVVTLHLIHEHLVCSVVEMMLKSSLLFYILVSFDGVHIPGLFITLVRR